MKVEFTEGCTSYSLDIDGIPFNKIHENSLDQITDMLARYIKKKSQEDKSYLQDLLVSTVERFGDSVSLGRCHQCGEDVFKTTLDLSLKRKPYKWGLKNYLSSFEIGEVRTYDRSYPWTSFKSVATMMKRDFGCVFSFSWKHKTITRVA